MNHIDIVRHYEGCLSKHGDTCKGVDWPNNEDAEKRYKVMLGLLPNGGKLLDFGCGTARMLDYIKANRIEGIQYYGLDASGKFVQVSQSKHPEETFWGKDVSRDLLEDDFDYIVCNGTFTEKCTLTQNEMWDHFSSTLKILWPHAKKGMAFNVMSKHVDWERDDLFHVGLDELASFLVNNLSRHFVIRNDYGLYEYTVYIYSESNE